MTDEFYENMLRLNEKIERDITEYGISVLSVFGGEDDDPSPCFAYTIGLKDSSFPELICFGVPGEYITPLFNQIFATYLFSGMTPEKGDVLAGFLRDDFTMRLGSVDHRWTEEKYLVQTSERQRRAGRPGLEALQVVIPDRQMRFPEDDGYDLEYMSPRQICLAPLEVWDYEPRNRIVTAKDANLRELSELMRGRRRPN